MKDSPAACQEAKIVFPFSPRIEYVSFELIERSRPNKSASPLRSSKLPSACSVSRSVKPRKTSKKIQFMIAIKTGKLKERVQDWSLHK
jgi:hypothetical protein